MSRLLMAILLIPVPIVAALRWVPPPVSAFMIQWRISAAMADAPPRRFSYHWFGRDSISPHMALAVVAAEDQKFPSHFGFDFNAIRDVLEKSREGKRLRGASTITQQVAKNLFLWPGRNLIRKGLESWLTLLIESLWPKQRILEVHLNIAQFGDGIFGVGAGAKTFFNKTPDRLTRTEAALMAAALPNPVRYQVSRPSPYVRGRAAWIERQMNRLGGAEYLKDIF